ncbi:hypothetical protein K4749_38905 [Streptomyces sp. TRM72054]|uniref:hypothetical protein n=1 Tax=Streptomyces sp. TRM72054 TaxID=2870562 RepID=UPI001C8B8E17|nr:hypothetical protein [Streptomyces sp. TRM72054]MBX9399365.1 hypothetical protein [Streptomyces sp. TRM72054]
MKIRTAVVAAVAAGAVLITGGSAIAAPSQPAGTVVSSVSPASQQYFVGTGPTQKMADNAAEAKMMAYDPACVRLATRFEHVVMGGWQATILAECPA